MPALALLASCPPHGADEVRTIEHLVGTILRQAGILRYAVSNRLRRSRHELAALGAIDMVTGLL